MRRFAVVLVVVVALAACGGGSSEGDQRADQVRKAAVAAKLPGDIADVLALAARGATATYRVTYAGTGGASLIVSQHGTADRRVDVVSGDTTVSSRILRHGVAYSCDIDTTKKTTDLTCTRVAGDLTQAGTFTPARLTTFTHQLAQARDQLDLSVTHRTIARTEATCLVTRPKGGGAVIDQLCLSDRGAQLLVATNGQHLQANAYTTDVPARTFDLPNAPAG